MGFIVKAVKSVVKAAVSVVKGVFGVAGFLIGGLFKHGNAKNSVTGQRLSKRLEAEDFRKIVFGKTAFACDLRFWEVHGSKYDRYSEVIAAATHTVEGFDELYLEDDLVTFSGNNATGTYAGVLSRTTNDGTPGNAALAVGSGSYWNASSKFRGCAHYALAWTYDEKKLPNGIPSRYTQVGRGARVYDPRKDSTRGGSGTHRVDDQSTWAYATADSNGQPIGRNNALQMLWYLIGWRIQNPSTGEWVLVAGRGVDPSDINWPEMIAAANDAEALQYYTDMALSTGDEHEQNESIISADGLLGELLDCGGLWTYRVTKDDTADVAVDLDDDDVVMGEVQWNPRAPLSQLFNEVAGTYIDPSATSLYQAKAYPTVKDAAYATDDGRKKRGTHNFQCVQDPSLAQKLARIKLNRTRFTGEFKATFGFRALKAQAWSIVRLSLERYGFTSKLFRVVSQSISDGGIEMVLREEDPSVYAGGTVTVPAAPSALAKYDIRQKVALTTLALVPIVTTGADGSAQDGLRLSWDAVPGNVRRVEVEYKQASNGAWASAGVVGADEVLKDVLPLLPATSYNVRARTWTIHEVPGDWQQVTASTGSATKVYITSLLSADGVLHPTEKLDVIREWDDVANEYAGLQAQATALGITTEFTTYSNAHGALSSYLVGLSPGWSDTTQSTTIARATWNSKWSTLYSARQALLNRMDQQASNYAANLAFVDMGTDAITRVGNTISKAGTGGFTAATRTATPFARTVWGAVDIAPAGLTAIGLDAGAAGYDRADCDFYAQYDQVSGDLSIYTGTAGLAYSITLGAGLSGRLEVLYDGLRWRCYVNGTKYGGDFSTTAGQDFYVKWFLYYTGAKLTGLSASYGPERAWSAIDGEGVPSDNAGTSDQLTALGSYTVVRGNTVYKRGGTHGAFEGAAVGNSGYGAVFVSSTVVLGTGGWHTVLGLDDDATSYTDAGCKWTALINPTGGGTYIWEVHEGGASIASGTGTGLTNSSKVLLGHDGLGSLWLLVDGAEKARVPGKGKDLTLWPKVLPFYDNNNGGNPFTNVLYGAWPQGAVLAANNALDDQVFDQQEKASFLIPLVAGLETRYAQVKTRADALGIATTNATNAKAAFHGYLDGLSPSWKDLTQPTPLVNPALVIYDGADLTGWSPLFTPTQAADGPYTAVTDNDGANTEALFKSFACNPSSSYTFACRVKKDAVGAATRQPAMQIFNNDGTSLSDILFFDTSVGPGSTSGTPGYVVFDPLSDTEWLAVVATATHADNTGIGVALYPAFSISGFGSAAATGSVSVKDLIVINTGSFDAIGRLAFEYRLRNYANELDALDKAISEVDGVTSLDIAPLPSTTIAADYTGVLKSGELPRDVGFKATSGLADVTASAAWSKSAPSNLTCTIGAATGILNITAFTGDEAEVTVTASYGGATRSIKHKVVRQKDNEPVGGTGGSGNPGTTSSDSTILGITSTSYPADGSQHGGVITVKAGTGGQVRCTFPAAFKRTPGTVTGSTGMYGKVRWRAVGGSWADVTTETAYTDFAETQANVGDPTLNLAGSISLDVTKTGLTSGTDYEFALFLRKSDLAGDVDSLYITSGSFTCAGS